LAVTGSRAHAHGREAVLVPALSARLRGSLQPARASADTLAREEVQLPGVPQDVLQDVAAAKAQRRQLPSHSAMSEPAMSGPAMSGPAMSGPAMSGPAMTAYGSLDPVNKKSSSYDKPKHGRKLTLALL
jgi:hypothetical protein